MNDWLVIVVIYAALFVTSPLIAILHELGHALAYLILTHPDRIDIYIGTYHKPKNAIRLNIGKIHFFIKSSFPFIKGIGLCHSHKAEINYRNYIIILLAGPVFTFLIACIPGLVVFTIQTPFLVQTACYVFLGLSTLSLIGNLVPRHIDKSYGINLDNDGKQILFTLSIKNTLPDYVEGLACLRKEEYDGALAKLKIVLDKVPTSKKILRLLVIASLAGRQLEDAALYAEIIEKHHELFADDMLDKACLLSLTNQHDEAIETYSKVLKKDRQNIIALNNIASELIEKGAYKVAQRALEKAIKLKPGFDYPYANFGYLKILQGELAEGLKMIDTCLDINDKNADAYKALGVYYLKLKDITQANASFEKALELDSTIELGIHQEELKLLQEQDVA